MPALENYQTIAIVSEMSALESLSQIVRCVSHSRRRRHFSSRLAARRPDSIAPTLNFQISATMAASPLMPSFGHGSIATICVTRNDFRRRNSVGTSTDGAAHFARFGLNGWHCKNPDNSLPPATKAASHFEGLASNFYPGPPPPCTKDSSSAPWFNLAFCSFCFRRTGCDQRRNRFAFRARDMSARLGTPLFPRRE